MARALLLKYYTNTFFRGEKNNHLPQTVAAGHVMCCKPPCRWSKALLPLTPMVIAVQTESRSGSPDGTYMGCIKDAVILLAAQFPEHQFYFLQRREKDAAVNAPNIQYDSTGLPGPDHWFYPWKLRSLLKKIKAGVLLTPEAMGAWGSPPQCLLVSWLPVFHRKGLWSSRKWFLKRKIKRSCRKAGFVATTSQFLKQQLIGQYQVPAAKIGVVPPAIPSCFQPQPDEQSDRIRDKYTEGAAYFLYMGTVRAEENLVPLLRAFSVFKKRQKSSMKLVLCGPYPEKNNLLRQQLSTYRHRQDIVVTGPLHNEEAALLLGAAYALVDPSPIHQHQLLQAMQCKIPVLAADTEDRKELAGTAALYGNPLDVAQTAEQLMLLYKDEALHHRLAEAGLLRSQQYTLEHTAGQLWTCILHTVKNETFTFAPQIQ